jgi:hypothetical protein
VGAIVGISMKEDGEKDGEVCVVKVNKTIVC